MRRLIMLVAGIIFGVMMVFVLPTMADFNIYPAAGTPPPTHSDWPTAWNQTSLIDPTGDYTQTASLDLYGTPASSVISYNFASTSPTPYYYFQIQLATALTPANIDGNSYFIYMKKVGDSNPITAAINLDLKGEGKGLVDHGLEAGIYGSGSLPRPAMEDVDGSRSFKLSSDIDNNGEGFARAVGSTIQIAVSRAYFEEIAAFSQLLNQFVQLGVATSRSANDHVAPNADWINASPYLSDPILLGNNGTVPELPAGMLIPLAMAPLGAVAWMRRKK